LEGDGSQDVHVEEVGGVGGVLGVESGVGQDGQQGAADGLCVRSVERVAEHELYGSGVGE
jgi:hypothetical protein